MEQVIHVRKLRYLVLSAMLLTGLVIGKAASAAGIATIDFDSTLPTVFGLADYSEDGFDLNSNTPDGTLIDQNDIVRGNLGIFSGGTSSQSLFFGENGTASEITITNSDNFGFDLLSLDASSLYNAAGQLTLTGTLSAGGSVSQILTLDGDLTTYAITGMTGLNGLTISFDGTVDDAPFDLDNIVMSVIPVPAAVWLFGSALAGLAGMRRLRKEA